MILDQEQIEWVVDEANKKINIPIIGEKLEGDILRAALDKILKVIDEKLPPKLTQTLKDLASGIEPGEPVSIAEVKADLVKEINEHVNIPIIGEKAEARIIDELLDILIEAITKNKRKKA